MSDSHGQRLMPAEKAGFAGMYPTENGGVRAAIADAFQREMEEGRGFLWLPVFFGIGILIYFALPQEPWMAATAGIAIAGAALAWISRRQPTLFRLTLAVAFMAAGTMTMTLRTDWVFAPKIPREMTAVVTGWVAERSLAARGGVRVTLRVHEMERLEPAESPRNVRVTIRSDTESISVGDAIAVTARLRPPNGPVIPGGYDFARAAFYEEIGGVGFAYGAARPADLGIAPLAVRLAEPLAWLRETIRKRVMAALPGDPGRIAVALITGDRGAISENTQDAMRASGLGHILAISGLHMALIAGAAFWVIRALLALSSELALRRPIKKWAATGALGVASLYLGISGAYVATQRAFIMLAIMLVAILLDRRAITLRNVALAAFVVLLISPESLLTASFQMSFAATIALVAAYEEITIWSSKRPHLVDRGAPGVLGRAGRFMSGLFVTSLVAGIATMPFAIFHFQRTAPLTLVANLLAMPALGLVVMPMALLSVVLMPFGLEILPLTLMNWGLQWVIAVAEWTTEWSGNAGSVRMAPALALLFVVAGFLWLTLWRERWRLLGLLPIVAAIPITALAPVPEILVNGDGMVAAIRGNEGRLSVMAGRSSGFVVENWLRADSDPRDTDSADLADGILCDPLGCIGIIGSDGTKVALVKRPDAFAEDCRFAAIIISRFEAPPDCANKAIVVDREKLERHGSHALYRVMDDTSPAQRYRITTAYPEIQRPWMPAFSIAE